MKFVVGSTNPVKLSCVRKVVKKFWDGAVVEGASIPSGVGDNPDTDAEIRAGAVNRAKIVLKQVKDADFGVGVEGGTVDRKDGMWAYAWVVVQSREGRRGFGKTGEFLLPKGVAKLVHQGMELGDADDVIFKRKNSKQQEGAVGLLTKKVVTRTMLYEQAVAFALISFIQPDLYE